MLPRDLRVNFKETGKTWRFFSKTPEFLIKIRPSSSTRFAVTVGVKTAKKSSRRNLLKRRIKGFILRNIGKFEAANRQNYWVRILPPANSLKQKEFIEKFKKALIK